MGAEPGNIVVVLDQPDLEALAVPDIMHAVQVVMVLLEKVLEIQLVMVQDKAIQRGISGNL